MTEALAQPVVPAAEERARLKEGVHIERSARRVRTYFGGRLIADSEHVLLVYETKRPPAYWFPIADVRMEYLEQSQQPADTIRWRLVVKDRIAQNGARAYITSTGDRAALEGHLTFYWDAMDAWFEEDEQVFVHPRDPYTRVDTVHSSRHVRVEIEGVTLAETLRPILLFETGLPIRYYIPKLDVRMNLARVHRVCHTMPVQRRGALLVGSGGRQARQGHRVELSSANSRVPEDRKPAQLLQRARRSVRRWGAAGATDCAVHLIAEGQSPQLQT